MGEKNFIAPSVLSVCFLVALLAPAKAAAGSNLEDVTQLTKAQQDQAERLAEQKRLLDQQAKELAEQRRELEALRQRLDAISGGKSNLENADLGKIRGTGDGGRVAEATTSTPVGRAPEPTTKPPEVAPLSERVGVLTPRGKFVLEPSLQYSHSSDSRVTLVGFTVIPAITIGLIDIRSVNRDMLVAALTGRYGVTDRLEVEAKVPWVYRADSTLARPLATPSVTDNVFDRSGNDLGDVELATRYQFTDRPPYYLGWLRLKTRTGTGPFEVSTSSPVSGLTVEDRLPTGTGFYSLQPGVTALVPSDPAVFFGGVSYIWNIKRNIDQLDANGNPIGTYDPGDGINFNFGMGLAINDRASFSVGYDHTTFLKDKQNGQTIQNAQTTQVGSLLFGVAYRVSPRTTFNLTLGAGITRAAPDVQLTLRLPITF